MAWHGMAVTLSSAQLQLQPNLTFLVSVVERNCSGLTLMRLQIKRCILRKIRNKSCKSVLITVGKVVAVIIMSPRHRHHAMRTKFKLVGLNYRRHSHH